MGLRDEIGKGSFESIVGVMQPVQHFRQFEVAAWKREKTQGLEEEDSLIMLQALDVEDE